MKRRLILLTAALLVVAAAPAAIAGEVPSTYDAALAAAAETGTPVVLDFFTEW
jgi:hypothetical protein